MFVSIFHGRARGLGEDPQKSIYMQVGVGLRKHLHHFKGAQLSVFMAICLHANEAGEAFPSYEVLEKETGYGSDTIAKALDKLCQLEIEGDRVLVRRRERDDKGKYIGGNHYLIFPTAQEVQMWEIPDVGKPKHKKNQTPKEEPIKNNNLRANDARAEPPQAMLFDDSATVVAQKPKPPEKQSTPKAPPDTQRMTEYIVLEWGVDSYARAGNIVKALQGRLPKGHTHRAYNLSPPVTFEELEEFTTDYYPKACKGCSFPRSPEKIQDHFYSMRRERTHSDIPPGYIRTGTGLQEVCW